MKKKTPSWRVDWYASKPPKVGQIVARLTPTNQCSHGRVVGVRVIANRTPLPPGALCRYLVSIEPIELAVGDEVAWTCNVYPRKRIPRADHPWGRFSPLL